LRRNVNRREPRWKTRFGSWASQVTVSEIAVNLSKMGVPVTQRAIYIWLSGRSAPRPDAAEAMVRLSKILRECHACGRPAGRLTLEDVYRHRHEVVNGNGKAATNP
jgi:hypothetical protein